MSSELSIGEAILLANRILSINEYIETKLMPRRLLVNMKVKARQKRWMTRKGAKPRLGSSPVDLSCSRPPVYILVGFRVHRQAPL